MSIDNAHHYHLLDAKGHYQGARFLNHDEVQRFKDRGWHPIPVANAHQDQREVDAVLALHAA